MLCLRTSCARRKTSVCVIKILLQNVFKLTARAYGAEEQLFPLEVQHTYKKKTSNSKDSNRRDIGDDEGSPDDTVNGREWEKKYLVIRPYEKFWLRYGDVVLLASGIRSQVEKERFLPRIIHGLLSAVTEKKSCFLVSAFRKDTGDMQEFAFIESCRRFNEKKACSCPCSYKMRSLCHRSGRSGD